jgi:hypothetical protein
MACRMGPSGKHLQLPQSPRPEGGQVPDKPVPPEPSGVRAGLRGEQGQEAIANEIPEACAAHRPPAKRLRPRDSQRGQSMPPPHLPGGLCRGDLR